MIRRLIRNVFVFCTHKPTDGPNIPLDEPTDYSKWVLARAASHNHNIEHLKRKRAKDRYSIHRLTNLSFMMEMVQFGYKYNLSMNEKIILLAQMNHVVEVLGKNRSHISEMSLLLKQILEHLDNPDDLPCLGTFVSSISMMGAYSHEMWLHIVECILASKFDEEYDELFGIVYGLRKYREELFSNNNFLAISADPVVPHIPVVYRNSLEVLRQFVTHNIFNLKECRLLFQSLYLANINESFFWNSVRDWFNIYTKEQLSKKEMDEYFIMSENAVDKVLYDNGIIRPRPILQELSSIVYVLSEFGYTSWRFIEFAQDLILYAMQNGSKLYFRFQELSNSEEEELQKQERQQVKHESLNEHINYYKEEEKLNVAKMEKKYRTIFVNPIEMKDQFIVHLLIVISRSYNLVNDGAKKKKDSDNRGFYDRKEEVYLDPRVKKWILIQLVKPEMRYTVKELLQVVDCAPFLQEAQIDLQRFVLEKLSNLRNLETNYGEVEKMLINIPPVHFDKLSPLLSHFLMRNHPSEVLKLTQLIEANDWAPYLLEVMLRLPQAVNFHERYFSFEENCYFLLILLQNSLYWEHLPHTDPLMIKYEGQMEQLKEHIKIITYNRGFKLSVNSYFHKVMNYIDVVDFFEGGRG